MVAIMNLIIISSSTTTDFIKENSMGWWQKHQLIYPNLAKMVCDTMAIPATDASVEREFSKSGRIATWGRSRLNPITVTEIMLFKNFVARQGQEVKSWERAELNMSIAEEKVNVSSPTGTVTSYLFCALTSAFASNNRFTTSVCPFLIAICSAVSLISSPALTSAFAHNNSSTTSLCPFSAARCNAVCPSSSCVATAVSLSGSSGICAKSPILSVSLKYQLGVHTYHFHLSFHVRQVCKSLPIRSWQ